MALNIFQRNKVAKIINSLKTENLNNIVQPLLKSFNALEKISNLNEVENRLKNDIFNLYENSGVKTSQLLITLKRKNDSKTITNDEVLSLKNIAIKIKKASIEAESLKQKADTVIERTQNKTNQYNPYQSNQVDQNKKVTPTQTEKTDQEKKTNSSQNQRTTTPPVQENHTPIQESTTTEPEHTLTQEEIDFENEVIKNNLKFSKEAKAFISSLLPNDPNLQDKIFNFVNEHADFFSGPDEVIEMVANGDLSLDLITQRMEEADSTINFSQNILNEHYSQERKNESSNPTQNTNTTPIQESTTTDPEHTLTQEEVDFENEVLKNNLNFSKEAKAFISSLLPNDLNLQDKIFNFVNEHADFFGGPDEVVEMVANGDLSLDLINEKIETADSTARSSQKTLGHGYVQKLGDDKTDPFYDTDLKTNPAKTFKNAKGIKTSYSHFNNQTNTAIINFETPITEIDSSKAGCAFDQKTGKKFIIGEISKTQIAGVSVRVNSNGIIDFSLPQNKELLSNPEVCAEIIKMYPESFKTLPPIIYATDPKLFAESFKNGTIKKVESGELGNENAVNYYENANLELSEMTTKAKGKGNATHNKIIETVANQVNLDQEIEREL